MTVDVLYLIENEITNYTDPQSIQTGHTRYRHSQTRPHETQKYNIFVFNYKQHSFSAGEICRRSFSSYLLQMVLQHRSFGFWQHRNFVGSCTSAAQFSRIQVYQPHIIGEPAMVQSLTWGLPSPSSATHLKFFLYIRNDAGIPMTYGVGASNNCSAQLMHVGSSGITGNMYSNGYNMVTKAITLIERAL